MTLVEPLAVLEVTAFLVPLVIGLPMAVIGALELASSPLLVSAERKKTAVWLAALGSVLVLAAISAPFLCLLMQEAPK